MGKELLTEAFSRLTSRLRAVAGQILKSDDDVADALQESFCRLWDSRVPESEAEAEGRCIVTVRHVSIDAAERRNRMADFNPEAFEKTEDADARETGIEDVQKRLLAGLPPLQRQVFELVGLRDFDYDVAAVRLGITEQAARANMCRARKTLRSLYNKL